jgi:hypothetical protein
MSLDIARVVHDAAFSGFGWRYLLSPAFRRRVHAAWKVMPRRDVIDEIVTLAVSFVLVNAFVAVALAGWLRG